MNIMSNTLYELLHNIPLVPPETGGLLGGVCGVISNIHFDFQNDDSDGYDRYSPNVRELNRVIRQWQSTGIEFYGIFHSHFPGGLGLSDGDKRYILGIMRSMPFQNGVLYFPIVFPKESIIVYRADKQNQKVYIVRDGIEIIYGGSPHGKN